MPAVNRKNRRVLCGAQPIPGHTIPVLRLAKHLHETGHTVRFVSFEENAPLIETHGIGTVRIEYSEDFATMIRRCAEIVERFEPDITICDWLMAFQVAARIKNVACTTSILRAEQFVGYEVINSHLPNKFHFGSLEYLSWFNGVIGTFGLPAVRDYREMLAGDLILIPSIPQLDAVPRDTGVYRNARIEYVGPLLLAGGGGIPGDLDAWMADKRRTRTPVILVTLGTVYDDADYEIYRCVSRILSNARCAALCVIPHDGMCSRLASETDGDAYIRCLRFTNLPLLMRQSDLVIHHCGHGTALLCLLSGVPSITMPSFEVDREDNAVRLERVGVSRRFNGDASSDNLERLVRDVLRDDRMKERSRYFARIVRESMEREGVEHAVLCMDEILSGKKREANRGYDTGHATI